MKTARQTGNLLEADDAFNSKSLGHEEILDVSYLQLTLIFIFPFYLFMYVTLFFISQHVFCNQPFYYLYRSCRISPGGLLFITPSICIFLFRFGTILVFFFTFYSFEIFSCILNCSWNKIHIAFSCYRNLVEVIYCSWSHHGYRWNTAHARGVKRQSINHEILIT